jgi:hypothetical protein
VGFFFGCIVEAIMNQLSIVQLNFSFLFALLTLITSGFLSLFFMLISIILAFSSGTFYKSVLKLSQEREK